MHNSLNTQKVALMSIVV